VLMKNRKNRIRRNTLDSIIHHNFLNMNKQFARRDAILLDSGFYDTETWGALRKCWTGFKIAKVDGDTKKMEYYAKGIRKFQRIENICLRILTIWSGRSKDARRTRFRKLLARQ
ncbi:MAG TPA: hypothetical protein VFI73_11000, partial [Candidatus Nitrosopolaris sp.]|nr:hypothetical protein [Candidatus Nitrosopolaris sp.]